MGKMYGRGYRNFIYVKDRTNGQTEEVSHFSDKSLSQWNRLFFVREFVKMRKIVREFVKTISFVIREKKKYRSRIREN